MKHVSVSLITFGAGIAFASRGVRVDLNFLRERELAFQKIKRAYPRLAAQISLDLAEPGGNPWDSTRVKIGKDGPRRNLGPIGTLVSKRLKAINQLVLNALRRNRRETQALIDVAGRWMRERTIVRVVGSGRALAAASLPANRLAHGGAIAPLLGDREPMPNSSRGGAVLALSASGATPIVLDIMQQTQELNRVRRARNEKEILIVGLSSVKAKRFARLCTPGFFVGFDSIASEKRPNLSALGDIEEYAMSEYLDALIVAAGLEVGINFRLGHEDIVGGATGPWHQLVDRFESIRK